MHSLSLSGPTDIPKACEIFSYVSTALAPQQHEGGTMKRLNPPFAGPHSPLSTPQAWMTINFEKREGYQMLGTKILRGSMVRKRRR